MKPIYHQRLTFFPTLILAAVLACGIGCDSEPEIFQYQIPTAVPIVLQPEQDRMIAVMVPVGDQVWFYKLTGPKAAVDTVDQRFEEFVESLQYDDQGPRLDALPDDWQLGGKRPFRFATIDVPTTTDDGEPGNQIDISVSKLSKQDDYDAMVAMNVNRWRGQLGLPPSDELRAGAEGIDVEAADDQSMWVDLVGESSGGTPPMMAGGFGADGFGAGGVGAGGFGGGDQMTDSTSDDSTDDDFAGDDSVADDSTDRNSAGRDNDAPVSFDVPDGWRAGRTSSMRLASFDVGPEDSAAEITVIPAGGDLRSNVARWIGQIRGSTPPEDVVDQAMREARRLTVDGRPGQRFYLGTDEASGTAIDASIIDLDDGFSLFVKMTGPAATVSDQAERIGDFLDSMKINL